MSAPVAHTGELGDGIVAVDTEYTRPLLDASHLLIEQGRAAFVDTGPNSAVPLLLDALGQFDLDAADVDYVFLTHIHLDHAGGAGQLMQALPNARCVLHPRGAPHMADPAKLIAGTEAVYGRAKAFEMYGEIVPIDAERIDVADDQGSFALAGRELTTFFTEGHARHHYCLSDPQSTSVFTGDSFGISYRELDTEAGEFIYPSSTPTHFDPLEAHKSIDRILSYHPRQLMLTHYSRVTDIDRLADDMHDCIDGYVAIAERCRDAEDRQAALEQGMFDYLADRIEAHGFDGGRDAIWPIIEFDVVLNAQGLNAWLARLERHGH